MKCACFDSLVAVQEVIDSYLVAHLAAQLQPRENVLRA